MSIQSILKYTYILIISIVVVLPSAPVYAQYGGAPADTATAKDTTEQKKKPDLAGHQLCIGIDLVRPVMNALVANKYGYEFEGDYYLHNEFYAVAEAGWGGSNVDYSDLKYSTTNSFVRFGFNKTLLARDNPRDWDMMFMGLRLAAGNVNRSAASYTVVDSLWGSSDSSHAGKSFVAVWAELTGGMRVELMQGLFAGWNVRGKFLLDGKSFRDLAPLYIAGYGRGDKNAVFDFNLYISYGIRWKRAKVTKSL